MLKHLRRRMLFETNSSSAQGPAGRHRYGYTHPAFACLVFALSDTQACTHSTSLLLGKECAFRTKQIKLCFPAVGKSRALKWAVRSVSCRSLPFSQLTRLFCQ